MHIGALGADHRGVNVRMEVDHGELPTQVGTVVATVLRESATNLLRHSKAENCEITIREEDGRIRAAFANDGVRPEPSRGSGARCASGGLDNLADRAAALGGTLASGIGSDGRFHVTVDLPKHRHLDTGGARPADAAA